MKYDFRDWLNTKPDDESYDYLNCTGDCAIGQFMKSRGMQWDYYTYLNYLNKIFGEGNHKPLALRPQTFGELKKELMN